MAEYNYFTTFLNFECDCKRTIIFIENIKEKVYYLSIEGPGTAVPAVPAPSVTALNIIIKFENITIHCIEID